MAEYSVEFVASAAKEFRSLPVDIKHRVGPVAGIGSNQLHIIHTDPATAEKNQVNACVQLRCRVQQVSGLTAGKPRITWKRQGPGILKTRVDEISVRG